MGAHKDYQTPEPCFLLKALLFAFWAQLAQSNPKGISYIVEVLWRDLFTEYGAQSAAKLDTKLER